MQPENRIVFDDWTKLARATPIDRVVIERGIKLRGRVECVGPCPKCGGVDRFAINTKKQVFNCRGCGVGGDVISLVELLDDCDFIEACEAITGVLCPTGEAGSKISPARRQEIEERRAIYATEAVRRDHEARADAKRKGELAQWLWDQSRPIAGTLAERYLRRFRGYGGLLPATLRFLPERGEYADAMIAPFAIPDEPEPGVLVVSEVVAAVHLTRLTEIGDRERGQGNTGKIIIGSPAGLPIVLAPASDLLAIDVCEGIENGLNYLELRHCGVWIAGSAGAMPVLARAFPSWVECVNIFADPGEVGIRKGRELAQELRKGGVPEINLKRIGSVSS